MNFFDNYLIINVKHLAVLYTMRDTKQAIIDSYPECIDWTQNADLKKAYYEVCDINERICETWKDIFNS